MTGMHPASSASSKSQPLLVTADSSINESAVTLYYYYYYYSFSLSMRSSTAPRCRTSGGVRPY